jgi:hypothetical protein
VYLRSFWCWTLPCDTAHSVLGSVLKVFTLPPLDWFFTGGELMGSWFLFAGDMMFLNAVDASI